jgi:hypothetical protein
MNLDLDAIEARAQAAKEQGNFVTRAQMESRLIDTDVPALLAMVREQQAAIERVEALAEKWRYKGEFGWGAWQEGHGPDPEGYLLDSVAGEIRAALTATKAS